MEFKETFKKVLEDSVSNFKTAERTLVAIYLSAYVRSSKHFPSEHHVFSGLGGCVSKKIIKEVTELFISSGKLSFIDGAWVMVEGISLEATKANGVASSHTPSQASPKTAIVASVDLPERSATPPSGTIGQPESVLWSRWICREMAHMVRNQYTSKGLKVPSNFLATDKNKSDWVSDMEKIIRIDGHSPKEIMELLHWIYNDNFWSGNILSPSKLREKYDNLILQSKRGSKIKSRVNQDYIDPDALAKERGLI